MNTIKSILQTASTRLLASSQSARLDAEVLLSYVLQKNRVFLYAHNHEQLEPALEQQFEALLTKRLNGMPIAYLTGEREFWSLPFYVSADTLIPRPETELLVELALTHFSDRKSCSVLELGTGTGVISIALATERPHWKLLAADINHASLLVAQKNAARHHTQHINFIASDWFESIPKQTFDLIIANPPYLAEHDPHQDEGDVRFEPKRALLSGPDGLDDLIHIIQKSRDYLTPGGLLLLEHGYMQTEAVATLFSDASYQNIRCWKDASNLDRVSGGWAP